MENQKQSSTVYNADGVEFTIYATTKPTKSGPRVYWVVVDYSTGKRRLLNNKTEKAARDRADKIRAAMVKGQASRMSLTNGQWQDACIALEIVRSVPTGDSLASAMRTWAVCIGMLDGKVDLLDAVKFYLANHQDSGPPYKPTQIADAAPLYHESKVLSGKSKSRCKNIKSRMERVIRTLPPGVRLDELTAGQLDAVVVGLGVKDKTRNEYRMMLNNLYSWASKQNPPLVPKGCNPAKEMERHKVKHQEVGFLRVHDLRTILATASARGSDVVPLIVVCFSGLRPSEAVRLDWREVGANHIRLPGEKSKTGYSRQIPIHENLTRWLALWRKNEGPVCPSINLSHLNRTIRHCSGVRLTHDAMRHCYGTHRQIIVKNVAIVADEMGNSAQVCRRHYLNAFCTEEEAVEWFGITPDMPANVINLPATAPTVTARNLRSRKSLSPRRCRLCLVHPLRTMARTFEDLAMRLSFAKRPSLKPPTRASSDRPRALAIFAPYALRSILVLKIPGRTDPPH